MVAATDQQVGAGVLLGHHPCGVRQEEVEPTAADHEQEAVAGEMGAKAHAPAVELAPVPLGLAPVACGVRRAGDRGEETKAAAAVRKRGRIARHRGTTYGIFGKRSNACAEHLRIVDDETWHAAQARLAEFADKWGSKYPPIVQSWRRNWEQVMPFFAYPPEVRRVIYTTNAIESLHMTLRKIIKTRGSFPNDDAATKLLYLALRNIKKGWKRSTREWTAALNQFAILFGDRLAASAR